MVNGLQPHGIIIRFHSISLISDCSIFPSATLITSFISTAIHRAGFSPQHTLTIFLLLLLLDCLQLLIVALQFLIFVFIFVVIPLLSVNHVKFEQNTGGAWGMQ